MAWLDTGFRRATSLSLVAALLVSGCSGSAPSNASAPGSGEVVVFADFAEPSVLNPVLSTESPRVSHLIFDSLVSADPQTGTPVPSLAESWEMSADGLTVTFHIRPNVTWSDGQPFSADDARFTFDAIRNPTNASPFKANFDQIASVNTPDPLTLQVTLKAPTCAFLLNAMSIGILPEHVLGKLADLRQDALNFNQQPTTGTGPFVYSERQKGDHITLVANPRYWRGRPKFDEWIFKVVPDANVEVVQLETGEVDYAIVQPDAMDELQAAGLNLQTYFGRGYDFIAYNLQRPFFQDPRVRQALTYALDRRQIVEQVLFGQGRLVDSPIPSISWAYNGSLPGYTYNLDTARTLLAEAGWTPGADGTLRKGDQAFQFTLDTNSGNKVRGADTVIAQAQFKKLGIDVQPETLELSAFNQKVRTRRDFDAAVYGVTTDLDPDQTATWSSSQAANSPNFIGYSNPAVDDLLRQAATVPGCGLPTRTQLYASFQKILADDQPYTFLYARKTVLAVNKRIDGIAPSGWAGDESGIQTWVVGPR